MRLSRSVPLAAAIAVVLCVTTACSPQTDPGVRPSHSTRPAAGLPSASPVTQLPESLHAQVFRTDVAPRVAGVPSRFTMWTDPWQAKWIGRTASGDYFYVGIDFFLAQHPKDAYAVLFLWDKTGAFETATVADLGEASASATDEAEHELLATLGGYRRGTLHVQPFAVNAFGSKVGFIPVKSTDGYPPAIEFLPANDMAFTAPWSYGHYDT